MLQFGNDKTGQVVFVDADGNQFPIKEVYLGADLVFQKDAKVKVYHASYIELGEEQLVEDENGDYILVTDGNGVGVTPSDKNFIIIDGIPYAQADKASYEWYKYRPVNFNNDTNGVLRKALHDVLMNAEIGKIYFIGTYWTSPIEVYVYLRIDSIEETDTDNILIDNQMGGGKFDLRYARKEVGYAA